MKLSAKTRRNIGRIIPFGVIWLGLGWVFLLVETAAMGTPAPNSPTIINLTIPVFVFASIAVFLVGVLVGVAELVYMENLFRTKPFLQKVLYKFGIYTCLMLLIIFVTYPVAASVELQLSLLNEGVWEKFSRYLGSITFWSTMLQMASSLLLCVVYAAISENLGYAVLTNIFTGKYHTPRVENRIFMFLDMYSSTALAEELGHMRYFQLLREYYSDLSGAIIKHAGEVYQYIGDEVVITWELQPGLENSNCVHCFFAMKKDLLKRANYYQQQFGKVPHFKAALHLGEVTTGEIGALKKEIFFTGDVLNATSRLQGMCHHYQAELLVSHQLLQQLHLADTFNIRSLGKPVLKGKLQQLQVFALSEKKQP